MLTSHFHFCAFFLLLFFWFCCLSPPELSLEDLNLLSLPNQPCWHCWPEGDLSSPSIVATVCLSLTSPAAGFGPNPLICCELVVVTAASGDMTGALGGGLKLRREPAAGAAFEVELAALADPLRPPGDGEANRLPGVLAWHKEESCQHYIPDWTFHIKIRWLSIQNSQFVLL